MNLHSQKSPPRRSCYQMAGDLGVRASKWMGGAQAWHRNAGTSMQGKRPGAPSGQSTLGVLVLRSSQGWSSCQLPRPAGTPQTLKCEAGLGGLCLAQPVSSAGPWDELCPSRQYVPRPGLLAGRAALA